MSPTAVNKRLSGGAIENGLDTDSGPFPSPAVSAQEGSP